MGHNDRRRSGRTFHKVYSSNAPPQKLSKLRKSSRLLSDTLKKIKGFLLSVWKSVLRHPTRSVLFFVPCLAFFFTLTGGFPSLQEYVTPSISIEPITDTNTDNFQDTKFEVTNQSPYAFYNLMAGYMLWDGDHPEIRTMLGSIDILPPILGAHMPTSIRFKFTPQTNPFTGEFIDPNKIERPILQIKMFFKPLSELLPQVVLTRRFYAYKNKVGIYVWCPLGGEPVLGNQPFPSLAPK
jgi:hypothetical protein